MDASLFEQVFMIREEGNADPTKFISPAVAQLTNWCQEEKPVLVFQPKSQSTFMSSIESPSSSLAKSV